MTATRCSTCGVPIESCYDPMVCAECEEVERQKHVRHTEYVAGCLLCWIKRAGGSGNDV